MKILVTGGSGFIGSHVIHELQKRQMSYITFDHHMHISTPLINRFLGDTRDFTAISEAVALSDGVIHLAGVLGTAETVNEPRPSIETNIYGSLNVFQACKNHNKKCVYISVGNYWMNNSYSITKHTAERFALMFNKEHGTQIAIVRALNAYGPWQKIKPVRKIIPNFIVPALKNKAIKVYGDGTQIMDMIYVRDVADILIRALIEKHGQYDKKFEAGTGQRISVQEIAQMVIDMVGSGSIENVPMRPGEPEGSIVVGDPSTLKPLYGGKDYPLVPLKHGLIPTIDYYRSLYKRDMLDA